MNKVRMTLRVIPSLDEKLKEIARDTGRRRNDLIVHACWQLVHAMKNGYLWIKEDK